MTSVTDAGQEFPTPPRPSQPQEERMGDVVSKTIEGVVVIQPALEPWPSLLRRFGPVALFAYFRWSSWSVGFDILGAGIAVQFGPVMIGACHINKQQDRFNARLPQRERTEHG